MQYVSPEIDADSGWRELYSTRVFDPGVEYNPYHPTVPDAVTR
jgi:hypothetical protein